MATAKPEKKLSLIQRIKQFKNLTYVLLGIAVLVMIIIAAAHRQTGIGAKKPTTKFESLQQNSGILFGCSELKPGVLLTLDDGPGDKTLKILDLLRNHNVTAMFFLAEHATDFHPELARKILDDGHELGLKVYDDDVMCKTLDDFNDRTKAAEQVLVNATGVHPRFVRLSNVTSEKLRAATAYGLTVVVWNGAVKKQMFVHAGDETDEDKKTKDDSQFQYLLDTLPHRGAILKLSENDPHVIRRLEYMLNEGGLTQYKPVDFLSPRECFHY